MYPRNALAALVTAVTLAGLAGCTYSTDKLHTPLERLDHDYNSGKAARDSMTRHGVAVTDRSCTDMYVSTDQEDHDSSRDKKWLAARQTAYVNGCMDRPRTELAPFGSPSPSGSPTVP